MSAWKTFYKTCIVLATLAGAYLAYRLAEILIVLFAAIIFASAIRPVVKVLERRGVHQGIATLLVYALVLLSLGGLLIVAVPPLIQLTVGLFSDGLITDTLGSLSTELAIFGWTKFKIPVTTFLQLPEVFRAMVDDSVELAQRQAWPYARTGLSVLSQIALALVMGYYWLTSREEILGLLLRLTPNGGRSRAELVWNDIETTVGAYLRGQAILMLIVGLASLAGLLVLRVPHAVALAVLAGLTEAIPMIGPFIGAVPAVLLGFTISPTIGLLVAGWYLIVQQVEGNVLVPKVMEKNVGLNPLVVLFALVAGTILNGVVGALLAIPVAGALQVTARHLLIEPVIQNHVQSHRMAPSVVKHGAEMEETEETEGAGSPALAPAGAADQSAQPSYLQKGSLGK